MQLWGLGRDSLDPSAFPTWQGEVFFPGGIPPDDSGNAESVMGIIPGDSGVVMGYQVDECIHTWSVKCFIA